LDSLNGLFVVDAVQGRISRAQINDLMNMGACVVFSPSKFFGAPSDTYAVMLPPDLINKLDNTMVQSDIPSKLNGVLSQADIP